MPDHPPSRRGIHIAACIALTAMLGACASTTVQRYEGRSTPPVIEGAGGIKEVADGIEIWGLGDPPHSYQVLGVVTVEDYATVFADGRIRSALAAKTKALGGDAAIAIDSTTGARYFGLGLALNDGTGPGLGIGRKAASFQVVKYVDKAK